MLRFPSGQVSAGSYIPLVDKRGEVIARGLYNRRSEIAFRCLGGPDAPEDFRELLRTRLAQAHRLRTRIFDLPARTDAWRLVNSEGDRLSGLVVDRYADTAVVLVYSIGYVTHAEILENELLRMPGIRRVHFRADARTQGLEGFHLPDLPAGLEVEVQEDGLAYAVDLSLGHKSGLFLDQRDQRWRVRSMARGRRVLDLGTNAGGFALSAAAGGATEVLGIDLDEKALARAKRNAALNGLRAEWLHEDFFDSMRGFLSEGRRFDLVVLDPAKVAQDRDDKARALAAYGDMNRLALGLVVPGGLLLTCSCSGAVSEAEFQSVLSRSSGEAERHATLLASFGAGPDHPISLDFPEGRYLKALLLRVE
jgi:23S rRNA (cytosine1962-C5)-methyltransferase